MSPFILAHARVTFSERLLYLYLYLAIADVAIHVQKIENEITNILVVLNILQLPE